MWSVLLEMFFFKFERNILLSPSPSNVGPLCKYCSSGSNNCTAGNGYGVRKELELVSFQALDTLDVDGACDTL